MTRGTLSIAFAALFALALAAHAADPAAQTGIFKGRVTLAGKPVTDAVVSLEGMPRETKRPDDGRLVKAVMDQRELRFIPRVLPVVSGATVEFPNNDKHWHNVYSKSEAKEFDLGLYAPGKSRSAKFDKPGVVRILCNVHPGMEAFIVVKEHPYFSATDKQGNYRIDGVPIGKHRLQVWHPQMGTRETRAEIVRSGEVLDVSFDLQKK
jgi:plastocyanin